jgi:hypothetical protein
MCFFKNKSIIFKSLNSKLFPKIKDRSLSSSHPKVSRGSKFKREKAEVINFAWPAISLALSSAHGLENGARLTPKNKARARLAQQQPSLSH